MAVEICWSCIACEHQSHQATSLSYLIWEGSTTLQEVRNEWVGMETFIFISAFNASVRSSRYSNLGFHFTLCDWRAWGESQASHATGVGDCCVIILTNSVSFPFFFSTIIIVSVKGFTRASSSSIRSACVAIGLSGSYFRVESNAIMEAWRSRQFSIRLSCELPFCFFSCSSCYRSVSQLLRCAQRARYRIRWARHELECRDCSLLCPTYRGTSLAPVCLALPLGPSSKHTFSQPFVKRNISAR